MQSSVNSAFSYTIRTVLLVQVGFVILTSVILMMFKGQEFLIASLYGGAVIIASTIYFGWRLNVATQTTNKQPSDYSVNSVELFKGVFIRFTMVVALLALGLGWLKLQPAGVLSGFIVAQLAYWFSRRSYGVTRRS